MPVFITHKSVLTFVLTLLLSRVLCKQNRQDAIACHTGPARMRICGTRPVYKRTLYIAHSSPKNPGLYIALKSKPLVTYTPCTAFHSCTLHHVLRIELIHTLDYIDVLVCTVVHVAEMQCVGVFYICTTPTHIFKSMRPPVRRAQCQTQRGALYVIETRAV